ncbi:hypothetical protein GOP47_0022976 [Adiantum capillus-veneris]|uniref:RING-type domain-containing protein n=1 Tax=Adiantum capillus-veneris TaxID=13818 RepID=A0A9D4Z6I0_ADICA|nr:hypothetical protein GOP47_0022976 [Adiantum capillus-veneris]
MNCNAQAGTVISEESCLESSSTSSIQKTEEASSIFILFWCGRYFCARFLVRQMPESRRLFLLGTGHTRTVAGHNDVGVSPLVMAYFPTITFHQDTSLPRQDSMCAVCLGEYKEEDLLRTLPQCGHNFHANCIDAWLQRHVTCPVCRMSLQGYFVGRTLGMHQSMDDQPEASPTNQPVYGIGLSALSGEPNLTVACMLPHASSNRSRENLVADNPLVLTVSSSQSSNRSDAFDSFHEQTARMDEHGNGGGLTHCTERG